MSRHYVTTAIDYPNAAPHMGHVLEKVLADVIVRWFRLRGDEVRFQIGTDEHGIKIQQTAKKEGMEPAPFVERNRKIFVELYGRLGISYDEPFMHTSGNSLHTKTVQELWKHLAAAKRSDGSPILEKRDYTALYCSGCERFITKKELVDGKCPDHQIPPQEVTEQNWFFTLSKDAEFLKKLLKEDYKIVPEFRAPETLTLLDQGLEDVSFSRPKSSLSWGIPVPGDENQTMYVWCDALTNYISGVHYFDDPELRDRYWEKDVTVTHVIGKDIARFHALIWPAMLQHGGIRTPDRLLIHGFLTSEGQKMSKSLGNVVVPQDVIDKYGIDPLRFYLSHEIPVGNDGDFSWKRFGELYDSKLRNQLGNLLNRVLVLLNKEGGKLGVFDQEGAVDGIWEQYERHINSFELSEALQQATVLANISNQYIDVRKVWTLKGEEKLNELTVLAERLRWIALLLLPFIPETAQRISRQLNVPYAEKMLERDFVITKELKQWGGVKEWKKVGTPEILFQPVEPA